MLTLFKSLVLSRLDYGSQLWSPFKAKDIRLLESVQRAFTKHIQGMHTYSYADRLSMLKLYSLQRRRDRYTIIYVWKILESITYLMFKRLLQTHGPYIITEKIKNIV